MKNNKNQSDQESVALTVRQGSESNFPVVQNKNGIKNESLSEAIEFWADQTTRGDLKRAKDIKRDKQKAVRDFLGFTNLSIEQVKPVHIVEWRDQIAQRLKPSTVYIRVSHLSSFFEWLKKEPLFHNFIQINPARLALPKAPAPYQNESAKALTDAELKNLWQTIKSEKETGEVAAVRDYTVFRFFVATGMRRSEILGLRSSDVELYQNGLLINTRVKGGDYLRSVVDDEEVKAALLDYLSVTGRDQSIFGTAKALWLRHDRAAQKRLREAGKSSQISSHAFDARMKTYAEKAGLQHFHLHQLRHTYARIVAEESGSIVETQDALGHKNLATTRVYVQRIAIKKDRFSQSIKARILNR